MRSSTERNTAPVVTRNSRLKKRLLQSGGLNVSVSANAVGLDVYSGRWNIAEERISMGVYSHKKETKINRHW